MLLTLARVRHLISPRWLEKIYSVSLSVPLERDLRAVLHCPSTLIREIPGRLHLAFWHSQAVLTG